MIEDVSDCGLMIVPGFRSDKTEASLCFGSVSTYTTIDQWLNEYLRGGRAIRRNKVYFLSYFHVPSLTGYS